MSHPVFRYTLHVLSLLVFGPIAFWLAGGLRDSAGSEAVTLFHNATPAKAAVFGAYTLIASVVAGTVGARLFSIGTGLTVAGYILAWAGWGLGTIGDVARSTGGEVPFVLFAVEGAIVMAGVAALGLWLTKSAGRGAHSNLWSESASSDGSPARPLDGLSAFGVAVVAAGAVAWFMASSDSHGQTLAAAFFSALAAGFAAEMMMHSRGSHARPIVSLVAVGLVAIVGPIVGLVIAGDQILEAAFAGKLNPLALPPSLMWAAGSLIGAPVGMGWAGHAIDRHPEVQDQPVSV